MEQIVILDFGSQFTQVIARRIRECQVYSSILRYDTPAAELAALHPKGLILSGGPASVYAKDAPMPDAAIFRMGIPILGICYGVQLLTHFLGGKVEPGQKREYGKGTLTLREGGGALFAHLPGTLQVWNSHGDKLAGIPAGFQTVATSDNSEFAAIEDPARHFYGLQFHPEVAHTPRGREILANFVHGVCGCGRNWTMRSFIDHAVERIRSEVGSEHVILGLSGGVDSSVAAALLHKAIGTQLTCIFVNNGLLRGARGRDGARCLWPAFQNQTAIRKRGAICSCSRLKGVTSSRSASGRLSARRSSRCFEAATARGQGEVSGAGHALSRRHRVGAHRGQSGGDDQEPSQRRRPAQEA